MNQPPSDPEKLTAESSAVQSYLDTLQNIIARMATNSSNCKTWCITLVSAILVVVVDKKIPNYTLVAFIPVILFLLLDAYYLGQEIDFREEYTNFVKKLRSGSATLENLFVIAPLKEDEIAGALFRGIRSFSIWPFYGVLAGVIILARSLIQ
jgi:hypothetical protein